MDGLTLLRRAHEAGLAVAAEGGKLVIRGPKRAEPVARLLIEHKPEVIAALAPAEHTMQPSDDERPAPADATWWRGWYAARIVHWFHGDRQRNEAEHLAYGELLDEWRKSHGRRWPEWQCAGCDAPIGGLSALPLADGNRVHFGEERECLIRFGQRWRGEAVAGLRALGLDPPIEFELL
jgi:hypothetical protein